MTKKVKAKIIRSVSSRPSVVANKETDLLLRFINNVESSNDTLTDNSNSIRRNKKRNTVINP